MRLALFLSIPAVASLLLADSPDWAKRSNEHAKVLLDVLTRFNPESAAQLGIEGHDEEIFDLKPDRFERLRTASRNALSELQRRLTAEQDPLVRQDLQIMVRETEDSIREAELNRKYEFPYHKLGQAIYGGVRSLLDDQVAVSRRPAAVVRLRRYAGMEAGYTPITVLAEQRIRERMTLPGLMGPPRDEVQKDLENADFFVKGVADLFTKYKVEGWPEPYAKLKEQLGTYNDFIRKEVLPKSRSDFRLPPELYAFRLRRIGVDVDAPTLVRMAHAAFDDIQHQMQALAPKVAKEKGYTVTGYRDVIRELKKEQLAGDQILPHYKARIAEIEGVLRRENLVSVPARPARMRLATPAESAAQPAPHMRPPRMIGNTGESGEFVLPLVTPSATGNDKKWTISRLPQPHTR